MALARVMVDMLVVPVVAMGVAMTLALEVVALEVVALEAVALEVVAMEVAVEVPSMEVEGDMVVQAVVDIILMGGRILLWQRFLGSCVTAKGGCQNL